MNISNQKDVIFQFFGSLPIVSETETDIDSRVEHYLDILNAVSDVFDETVYVVDFKPPCFRFVSPKGIFLCGRSSDEVMRLGYEFYPEVIHPKDIQHVAKYHQVIVDYFSHPKIPLQDLAYIIFNFRLREYQGKMILSHKVMPFLVVNNRATMAICSVSRSADKKPWDMYAYHNGKEPVRYRYSFGSRQWIPEPIAKLNQQEWLILNLSCQGIKGEEAAKIIGISHSYLRSAQSAMFEKLDVDNMTQALIFVQNHKIIVEPNQRKKKEQPKVRRKMTQDKIQRIQKRLDKGESINSIAIQENTLESNIRYYVDTGKLKKNESNSQIDSN